MSENEKVVLCKSLIPDVSVGNDEILAYLKLASQRIINCLYPFGNGSENLPARYDQLHCELTVRMIARRGGEGEVNHSENGISRTWANADDADLLSGIVPCVGGI